MVQREEEEGRRGWEEEEGEKKVRGGWVGRKREDEREPDERRPIKNTKHEEGAKSQHRGGGRIGGLEVHRLTPSHGVACLLTRQHVAA